MNNKQRIELIKQKLIARLQPEAIEIIDESRFHQGHPGAKDGRGHFALNITASCFSGKSLIDRHKMIYAALDDLMQTDIHALRMNAKAPNSQ